jgi:Ankyrin repeats (3 copies)
MKSPATYFKNTALHAESIEPSFTHLPTISDLLYEYEKEAPITTQKTNMKQMTPNKEHDLSQQQIIKQLKKYITAKNRIPDPPLEERGYCLGLTSVWLLRMARNEGIPFESELMSIATLTKKEIAILPDRMDTPIERFFNLLQWTQQSGKLLKIPQVNPLDRDPAFISTLKLTLTGTPSWCGHLLYVPKCHELDSISLTPKDTLILLRFFNHAVALYRNEKGLWFYDPNGKNGARLLQSRETLSEVLWSANGGGEYLTFSIDLYGYKDQAVTLDAPDHLATLLAEEMVFSGFLHASDINGCTALLNAAKQGHHHTLKALLHFGADANKAGYHGVTPLLIATIKNHLSIVKDLIAHGVDLNKADDDGATPLWIATQNGYIEIAQALRNAGAKESPFDQ